MPQVTSIWCCTATQTWIQSSFQLSQSVDAGDLWATLALGSTRAECYSVYGQRKWLSKQSSIGWCWQSCGLASSAERRSRCTFPSGLLTSGRPRSGVFCYLTSSLHYRWWTWLLGPWKSRRYQKRAGRYRTQKAPNLECNAPAHKVHFSSH